jgi:hypothetical protein
MVAVAKHGSAPTQQTIQSSRDADSHTLHCARKRSLPGSLDDQIQVIRLHGKLNQPSAEPCLRDMKGRTTSFASAWCLRLGRPFESFIVTCTGCRAFNSARRRCDTPGVFPSFGFWPAPALLPP